MIETAVCPYWNLYGHCNLSGCTQPEYQKDNYCVTPKEKEQWKSCANYQGASGEDKINKRLRWDTHFTS